MLFTHQTLQWQIKNSIKYLYIHNKWTSYLVRANKPQLNTYGIEICHVECVKWASNLNGANQIQLITYKNRIGHIGYAKWTSKPPRANQVELSTYKTRIDHKGGVKWTSSPKGKINFNFMHTHACKMKLKSCNRLDLQTKCSLLDHLTSKFLNIWFLITSIV